MEVRLDKAKQVRYTMGMSKELKQYFQKIGRKGGVVRSERKTYACRENGRKGGRPKKEEKN